MIRVVRPARDLVSSLLPVVLAVFAGQTVTAQESAPVVCKPATTPQGTVVYRPVNRPIDRLLRPKTLYLSNYAGAQYPPLFARDPAREAQYSVRRPVGRRFGWFGWGR